MHGQQISGHLTHHATLPRFLRVGCLRLRRELSALRMTEKAGIEEPVRVYEVRWRESDSAT